MGGLFCMAIGAIVILSSLRLMQGFFSEIPTNFRGNLVIRHFVNCLYANDTLG